MNSKKNTGFLTKIGYQEVAGALFIFDITCRNSFKSLDQLLKDYKLNTSSIVIILPANKIDLQEQRKVSKLEAAQFVFEYSLVYLETRAIDDYGIQQEMEQLATSTLIRNHKIIAIN
ncbi:unnamed protein product [Paramecium pentaurelia]|uniref:Uncharacterized protein n=1 Tax=Paramecium pentaurelia TaxID=43138 RepID=A0A8S1U692_9CILI|nr:unnamed protein product [Paramecium pentaurelia]